jgi:predicted glycosyltransferase involved in capsule biosynthesis
MRLIYAFSSLWLLSGKLSPRFNGKSIIVNHSSKKDRTIEQAIESWHYRTSPADFSVSEIATDGTVAVVNEWDYSHDVTNSNSVINCFTLFCFYYCARLQ